MFRNPLHLILKLGRHALTMAFISMMCCNISYAYLSNAQSVKSIKELSLEIEFKNKSIIEVFREIEKSTEYTFAYDQSDIDKKLKITRKYDHSNKVADILYDISNDAGLNFKQINNNIIVTKPSLKKDLKNSIIEVIIQTRNVTGKITSQEDQEGLPGVNIIEKGTSNGTITDAAGVFSLTVSEGATLTFSSVGYITQEFEVGNRTVIDLVMVQDIQQLDELIFVGYGTVRKSDLTGSVERISAGEFRDQNMTQLTEMLTGTIAGFNAEQGARAAGGGSLEIRGPTSLKARTDPLIVVDGVIFNGNLRDINPHDIESIDVLKDASSAAVFGSRAASGVVIITTSKGKAGPPTINFSSNVGIAQVTNSSIRPLNGKEYTEFRKSLLVMENPNMPNYYYHNPYELPSQISMEQWHNLSNNPNADITREWLNRLLFTSDEVANYEAGNVENWYDRVIQTGLRQNYDVSIQSGTETTSFYWSLGYTDNEGVQVGDEFITFRSRLNVNSKISEFLNVGVNAQYANEDNGAVLSNLGQMLTNSPYGNMYEADGSIKWHPNGLTNTINPLINNLLQQRLSKGNSLFGSIYADIALPFNFSYRLSYQPRLSNLNDYNFWGSNTIMGSRTYSNGYGTRQDDKTYEWMVDNLLKWNKLYGMHNFDFTFLYNLEKFQSWSSFQSGENFEPNQNLSYNALQFATNYLISNNDEYHTGDALMARLNYTLNNKYLFTASFRRDGYSAFGQSNPRANFPSLALAWIISDENFYNLKFLNLLKIRTSWGVNGNREIGRYAALATLNRNIYSDGSNVLMGVYNTSLANPDLRWERTEAFNIGLDFGFLEGRINGSIDMYEMTTSDLLMDRNLPQITGFENIAANLGKLQNRGFELTLNSTNVNTSNFQWKSNAVLSLNRNKIISLFGDYEEIEVDGKIIRREIPDITNQWFIGQAIDRIWDYEIVGVWQIGEEEEAKVYGLKPGDYKAVDLNDDGVYSALDDKQFIGWRRPRYRIGFRNNFVLFRNLSASVFLRSDLGHMGSIAIFKHAGGNIYDRSGMRNVPYWTPENPSNKYGSLVANRGQYGGDYNIYFDRSFLRIQDVTLSYSLPTSVYQRLSMQSLRIVGSIRNLYSFNKWENWDPESNTVPMPRVFTIGIDLTL
jgi:TonB-dependent starch-binding outer membrane protein SusC